VGDEIKIRPNSTKLTLVESSRSSRAISGADWTEHRSERLSGKVLSLPKREDINLPVNEQLIVGTVQ